MRRLLPGASVEVDLHDAYRTAAGVDHLRVGFVASADGSATAQGASGGLSSAGDKAVFGVLRSQCDVVLVGASTARVEDYGPVRQHRVPIAVVTWRLDLDPAARLFDPAAPRPLLLTSTSAPGQERFTDIAEVVHVGRDDVPAAGVVAALRARGLHRILCEGGPSLFGQLAAADLVDELDLTVSPVLAGSAGPRILTHGELTIPHRLELLHVLEDDGFLFLRYGRQPPQDGSDGSDGSA